ncbi:CIC11C00000003803 [Sungouiella intermedia]|uniref:CIC11C00000003803 n=1 Tax=Sungouiella intermedia TaxID=45354 RepID=A0A1L0DTX5_9ASCO|nr:CIC11C00000003803 [[Candida] intermedia]
MGHSSSKLPEVNTRKPKSVTPTIVDITFEELNGTEFQLHFPSTSPWSARWLRLFPGMLQFSEGSTRDDPTVMAVYPVENNDYAIQLPPRRGDRRAFLRILNVPTEVLYLLEYKSDSGVKYTFELLHSDTQDGSWILKQSVPPCGQTKDSQNGIAKWFPGDLSKGEIGHFETLLESWNLTFGIYFPLVVMATALYIECINNPKLCKQGNSTYPGPDLAGRYGNPGGIAEYMS